MGLGDPADALRAMVELARRHAEDVRANARRQADRARELRSAEQETVEARRAAVEFGGAVLHCPRCNADWRADAVKEAMRRKAGCLVCGGPLTPVP